MLQTLIVCREKVYSVEMVSQEALGIYLRRSHLVDQPEPEASVATASTATEIYTKRRMYDKVLPL